MNAFKVALCLLAILVAYGIAGHLDYEDAVRLEQIRQERLRAVCLVSYPPSDCEDLATGQPITPPASMR